MKWQSRALSDQLITLLWKVAFSSFGCSQVFWFFFFLIPPLQACILSWNGGGSERGAKGRFLVILDLCAVAGSFCCRICFALGSVGRILEFYLHLTFFYPFFFCPVLFETCGSQEHQPWSWCSILCSGTGQPGPSGITSVLQAGFSQSPAQITDGVSVILTSL